MKLMCISIAIGKQKKSLLRAWVNGGLEALKTKAEYVSLIRFVTQDAALQKSLRNEVRRKSIAERKK